ncbi:LOW QUALITY PROTEIN: hypothetical protein V1477_011447 [Vespula maculifrons]|uniref:Transposase n=1 Tax=Vespula maculifrons TaxID=7453 RepID=A0ABD2BZ74_VESMC
MCYGIILNRNNLLINLKLGCYDMITSSSDNHSIKATENLNRYINRRKVKLNKVQFDAMSLKYLSNELIFA